MQDQSFFEALEERVSDDIDAPSVVLDRSLRIRGVNAAFETASMRDRRDLIGEMLFETFPDNPDDPHANGVEKLAASFDTVLRTQSVHHMGVQRYDIPDVANEGQFIPKVWLPKNGPLDDGTEVKGILHRVVEITEASRAVIELAQQIENDVAPTPSELVHTFAAFTAALPGSRDRLTALAKENEELRRGLENRDTIGQAKGMLMERFNTDADQAFGILIKLSQDSHMRVVEVCRRLLDADHPPQS